MKKKSTNVFFSGILTATVLFINAQSANAASATWNGAASTNVLNTSGNWVGGVAPTTSGDTATFDGTQSGNLSLSWTGGFGSSTAGTSVNITSGQSSSLLIGSSSTLTTATGDYFALGHLTIASGAGAITIGDSSAAIDNFVFRNPGGTTANILTNDSSNTANITSNVRFSSGGGSARLITFAGSGNWDVASSLLPGGVGTFNIVKTGSGTLSLSNTGGIATATYTISGGILKVTGSGLLGNANISGSVTNNATLSYESSATQTLSGVISGSGTISQSNGVLVLSNSNNTFSGATNITGGTLQVSGAGAINSTSSISVNGSSAKYLHTSSTASTRSISLTQGTVAGTGTLGDVTVANGTGVLANGNANSGYLTLGNLTFNGAAVISITDDGNSSTTALDVTGSTVTTPASGTITVNASNSFWNSGSTYDLVNLGTFSGAVTDFTKGTITGLTSRQNANLVLNGSFLGLQVLGDTPKWTGLDSSNWVVGSTGGSGNWKLITGGSQTNYIDGDVVLFDDSATNNTVNISAADVNPAVTNFDNSTTNYFLGGSFAIASGIVNKNGTGDLTISNSNSYAGGTNINDGKIIMSGSGTLGATSGALSIAEGTLNLGTTSQTVGSVTLTGNSTVENGSLTSTDLTANIPDGSTAQVSASIDLGVGGLSKSGDGIFELTGASNYVGSTTVSAGVLQLGGSASLSSSSSITLSGGAIDLGTTTQTTNALNITSAYANGDTITNGTITPSAITFTASSGVATVSADIAGSSGVSLSGAAGTLSLTGNNSFSGVVNYTANSTLIINGGSNSGGGAVTYNSFGTTFTINAGSYLTSGITTNNLSEFRFLNLNGGVLESTGNIFADTSAITISFNGGTLKSGNMNGITIYDYNNLVQIGSGATFDTTVGSITVGNNADMISTGTTHIPTVNTPQLFGTGFGVITLKGGNILISGVSNNGLLEIQDASTWDINGINSTVGGLSGDGTVTNNSVAAVLAIDTSGTHSYAGDIVGGANLSLVKSGLGTQTLTGANSYAGDTTVNAGVLAVDGGAIPDAGKLIINGGTVEASGTEVVASLFFGTTQQAAGTWGATGSGATNIDDTHFSGTLGVVSVTTGPSGYSTWATANAGGQAADLDFDNDCVPNGVEFFMGETGSTFTTNPTPVNGTVTWVKSASYAGSYKVETSDDLQNWTDVTSSAVDNGSSVTYTLPTGFAKKFVRLSVEPS